MTHATLQSQVSFARFSEMGPDFQRLHQMRWQLMHGYWNTAKDSPKYRHLSFSPLDDMLRLYATASEFWFMSIMLAFALHKPWPNPQAVKQLWQSLRTVFLPPLRAELENDQAQPFLAALTEVLTSIEENSDFTALRRRLISHCYGPFSDEELAYVEQKDRRIVEVGGGSLMLARALHDWGIDIIAVESGKYDSEWAHTAHQKYLAGQGRFIKGGVERLAEFAAGRSLLISWPEPGSDFPAKALKTFADNGGRRFLLKLGGFCGVVSARQRVSNPGQNIRCFFDQLIKGWHEVADPARPLFCPSDEQNSLLVFEKN
jgi:hypothetical protein